MEDSDIGHLKFVFTTVEEDGFDSIVAKDSCELSEFEKEEIVKRLETPPYQKNDYELANDLRNTLERLNKNTIKKILREFGYGPFNVAEKIDNITVETDKFYYKSSSLYFSNFNPTYFNKKVYDASKYYAEIKFGENHPFSKAKKKYLKEKREKLEKQKEKRKQREIEKAKKLLKENANKS